MFEHMKNYDLLLHKISTWLKQSASKDTDPSLLFVHIFCHKSQVYDFEDDDGWMAQTFFSGLFLSPLLIHTFSFTDPIRSAFQPHHNDE